MILVFGSNGQVATELRRLSEPRQMTFLSRAEADLADPGACAAQILKHRPQAVINAAAYTAVDKAEEDEALATTVNAEAPAAMAQVCANDNVPFLHISTDYVFDGSGSRAWREDDPVAPPNAYGRSKLAGEDAVRSAGGPHAILRTSWVVSAHGANFIKTMLRLAKSRDHLRIVADQVGGPTSASSIAQAVITIADAIRDGQTGGTYHFAGAPYVSWAGFAREIFAQAGHAVSVEDISTAEYPTPATRPLNSRLDCSRIRSDFGIEQPDWRVALADILKELTE